VTDQIDLSVLLPTYRGDDPDHLNKAITSVVEQTRTPDELVVVRDGPLTPELNAVLERWDEDDRIPLVQVALSENVGLGGALREGIKNVSGEYVARMDSDDISISDRFEKQTAYLREHPDVDLLGGYIAEFIGTPENLLAKRTVPTSHDAIAQMARFRSPFNHATVVMRTDAVLSAGNYRAVDRMEDWDLWSRMFLNGSEMANLSEVLLYVRAGEAMYGRRGGIEYTMAEFARQREFLQRGFVTPWQFMRNVVTRVPVRVLPSRIRGLLYKLYFRDN
jgi:glycosyltransferase involved in cell wall biosynthesis